jgi:hypothetical protein
MNIEQILEMWNKDSQIDEFKLDEATRDTSKMHAKYLELLTISKLQHRKKEAEFKVLLKDKWLYYNGKLSQDEMDARGWKYDPFNGLSKPLKGEMDFYYDSDEDIIRAQQQIEYLKTTIDTIEEIINTLRWRHQSIKNMIEWRKFESGI